MLASRRKKICRSISKVPDSLSKEISLCLFRVMQSALTNALKHSRVKTFEVNLNGTSEGICLAVHDEGVGFDLDKTLTGHGIGIISMRERIRFVNRKLPIHSQPNCGTTIEVNVPLASEVARSQTA